MSGDRYTSCRRFPYTARRKRSGAWRVRVILPRSFFRLTRRDRARINVQQQTGLMHLSSAIIENASGMSTREFAEQDFFEPLGDGQNRSIAVSLRVIKE